MPRSWYNTVSDFHVPLEKARIDAPKAVPAGVRGWVVCEDFDEDL